MRLAKKFKIAKNIKKIKGFYRYMSNIIINTIYYKE